MSARLLAVRRALDRLTLYMPLLVMSVLAMGSWWLVRSMPDLWSGPAQTQVRREPDYHLVNFSTQVFNAQGRRTSQISGAKARHYPDTDELHIDQVRLVSVSEQGVEVQASAQRGIASADGDRVTLLGDVRVVREAHGPSARLEFRGQRLVALQNEEKLVSDVPVEILRAHDRFNANALDFDMKSGQYLLTGRVRGVLQPSKP
jgi:lipopolysaccharide export system protein LptC